MENEPIEIKLVTEKSHYMPAEQVNGLALFHIKKQRNNIELTLNVTGHETVTNPITSRFLASEVHFSQNITLYKGNLSPSKYKFPFTYNLSNTLPQSVSFNRNGNLAEVKYFHKTLIKLHNNENVIEQIFDLDIYHPRLDPTGLQCNKNHEIAGCCSKQTVSFHTSVGCNIFENGASMPIYVNLNRNKSKIIHFEIELAAKEFVFMKALGLDVNWEKEMHKETTKLEFTASETNKENVLEIPITFETDFLTCLGKIVSSHFNIEITLRMPGVPYEKGLDYHIKLIYPILRKQVLPDIETEKFSEYSDWQCPQELGTKVSIFRLEQNIMPYEVSQNKIGMQGGDYLHFEETNSFQNPFSDTRSQRGTSLYNRNGSGFGIAVPIMEEDFQLGRGHNTMVGGKIIENDDELKSSFLSQNMDSERSLVDNEDEEV